jgi:uncharacterized protein
MPLAVNLRHLADHDLALKGELPTAELDIETRDDMLRIAGPLAYDIEVQKLDEGLLLRGRLALTLDCQCVRCLKPFQHRLEIPAWVCDVPLAGEEKAPIINDCVDLTPYLREDTLLAFPQHPLCRPECGGLKGPRKPKEKASVSETEISSSAWAELDKLKL